MSSATSNALPQATLSMAFAVDWKKIELVRSSLAGLVQATTMSEAGGELLATVAAELLENAVKISDDFGRPWVEFSVAIDGEEVCVEVINQVDVRSEAYARFRGAWDLLQSEDSASDAYRTCLQSIYEGGDEDLSLAQIRSLGCTVETRLSESGLHVRAVSSLENLSGPSTALPAAANDAALADAPPQKRHTREQ